VESPDRVAEIADRVAEIRDQAGEKPRFDTDELTVGFRG
jgi:hypothetical protein